MQVGVEKVTLNGRMRMTLKPLMDEMPIVAAIQVRFQLLAVHQVKLVIDTDHLNWTHWTNLGLCPW